MEAVIFIFSKKHQLLYSESQVVNPDPSNVVTFFPLNAKKTYIIIYLQQAVSHVEDRSNNCSTSDKSKYDAGTIGCEIICLS